MHQTSLVQVIGYCVTSRIESFMTETVMCFMEDVRVVWSENNNLMPSS